VKHRDDRTRELREDHLDGAIHEGSAKSNPKVHFVAFDQIDKAPEEKAEASRSRQRTWSMRPTPGTMRTSTVRVTRNYVEEQIQGAAQMDERFCGGGDGWSDAADDETYSARQSVGVTFH